MINELINSREIVHDEDGSKNIELANSRISKFLSDVEGGRVTMKSPVQLPFFITMNMKFGFNDIIRIPQIDYLSRTWFSAALFAIQHPENWEEVPINNMFAYALEQVDDFMKTPKEDKFRTEVSLSNQDWSELALRGVEAKKLKNAPDLIFKRKHDQTPISFSCDVDDIDSFVESDFYLQKSNITTNYLSERLTTLLSLSGDNDLSIEFCEVFFSTNIGVALTQLQAVLTEVNISRLQNCKKHSFVLKWCEQANCFILIKPTRASEQIFFSIAVHCSSFVSGRPFKNMIQYGDFYISDFVSMDTNRLSHQIACPERACSLLSFWCHQFGILPLDFLTRGNKNISKHFLSSLLFYMEDKENTSSSMQTFRYAYMEMIKGPNRMMDPLKVLNKISDKPRSRLLVWAIKRFMTAFIKMLESPPVFGLKETDDLANETSQDLVQNLISWVTLEPVKKFETCINLCYFGVLHNKEEGDKVAGFLKIFEKVIQEELLLRDSNPMFMGGSEPPEGHSYKSHEFSPSMVSKMGRVVKSYLSNKGGGSMRWCEEKIYETLVNKDILEYATMKSSALPMKKNMEFTNIVDMNLRRRTTEAVKELLDRGYNNSIMLDIDKIEREVASVGGVQSNLFKKMQIGGTREIFVLTIESRVLISFCETTCRSLCEELPNEMLTKGDQKMLRNDQHFKTTNKIPGNFTTTVSSSDDATTWAQKFIMNAFACFLCNVFDDDIFNFLGVILNHCTNKRLELPRELLETFRKHTDVMSFSNNINELKEQFLGRSRKNDLVEKDGCLLKNRSNMMQGILHYTSSLFHSGFLLLWSDFSSRVISASLSKSIKDHVITTKVSSDDSSVLISTRFKNHDDRSRINKVFYSLIKLKERMYPYFCCKQSVEKSTVGVYWTIEEFNSTWLMRNTIITPLIKFVVSATQIHTSPRLESRLFTAATLRSQILENCGSMMISSIVQICQARLHYIALGAANSKLWLPFIINLSEKPHHTCGFMPLEPDLLCGMLGSNYAMYKFYMRNRSARNIQASLFRNMGSEYSKDCSPTSRIFISYGHNSKYYDFLRNMGLSDKANEISSIEGLLDERVEMLYRNSRDVEETKIKLLIKSSDPDLSQAFSFLNSSKTFATASYILQEPCMHLIRSTSTDGVVKFDKCSLMQWIRIVDDSDKHDVDKIMKLNFPSWKLYDTLTREISALNPRMLGLCNDRRRVFITVPIPKQSSLTPMSVYDACRRLWFNHDVRGSRAAVEATMTYFRDIYPWLSDSYKETYDKSPFSSHILLNKFLLSLNPVSKTIRMTTPSRVKQSGLLTILDAVKWNQFPGHLLMSDLYEIEESSDYIMDSFIQSLWRIKSAPPIRDKNYLVDKLCRSYPDLLTDNPNIVDIMTQGKMKFNALILQCAVLNPMMAIPLLVKFNRGVFGGFTVRQRFDEDTSEYVGDGTFSGSIDGSKFTMFIKDKNVKKVIVESIQSFLNKSSTFNWFIRDLGLEFACKKGRSSSYYTGSKLLSTWTESSCLMVEGDVIHHWENKGVAFDCDRRGRIRIRTDDDRPVTLLSFVPSVRHTLVARELESFMVDPIMSCWIWDKPINHEDGFKLITIGSKLPEMNEWVVSSLIKRLEMKGYQVNPKCKVLSDDDDTSEDSNPNPRQVTENLRKMISDDSFDDDDLFALIGENNSDASSVSDADFGFDNYEEMNLFSDDYISRQPIKSQFEADALSVSRFWDDTIHYLLDLSSFATIERTMNGEPIRHPLMAPVQDFVRRIRTDSVI